MKVIRINKLEDLHDLCVGDLKFKVTVFSDSDGTNYHIYLLRRDTGGLVEFADIIWIPKDPGSTIHSFLDGCEKFEKILEYIIVFNKKEELNYFFVGNEEK